jgi:hypothetical protein
VVLEGPEVPRDGFELRPIISEACTKRAYNINPSAGDEGSAGHVNWVVGNRGLFIKQSETTGSRSDHELPQRRVDSGARNKFERAEKLNHCLGSVSDPGVASVVLAFQVETEA